MRTDASMTGPTRARRGLTALLLLPLLLVLAGCFRLDMGLTINEDETLDVTMEVADRTGMASRDDLDCADLESQLTDAPEEVEFTVTEIEDEDGLGCRMEAIGSPIDAMTGEGLSIEKVDDTYVFSFEGDATGMDTGSLEDMPAGMEPQVSISVTFPGEVIEADGGEVDGNTVTWSGVEAFTAGGTATGEATGGGAGGVDTWVWVVLAVVALAAIAALVYLITKKNRGGSAAADTAPYGAPAAPYGQGGQPGQVPNEPGPGFPAQAGASQPQGGFGPADQVPADPGPGYPGDPNPPSVDPSTTAVADTPVDRPEGSPFAPPPEPPAQPGNEDDQQR